MVSNRILEALGLTLMDSLWQGLIVMAIAVLGLHLMRKSKASYRHNFLLFCILTLPILGIVSFSEHWESQSALVNIPNVDAEPLGLTSLGINSSEQAISTATVAEKFKFIPVHYSKWFGLSWFIGILLLMSRSLAGIIYLKRLNSGALLLDTPELNQLLERLKVGFELNRQVKIKQSAKISSPVVYGYFKPVILFPLGLIQGLSTDEIEVILLHELSHLKRNDFLINIVINVIRTCYFYHPVFWFLQNQLDNEREFAADEMVLKFKNDGLSLIKALSKTQEFKMNQVTVGFAGSSKNQLLKRVNRIMKKQQKPNWLGSIFACFILLSVFVLTSQSTKEKMDESSDPIVNVVDQPSIDLDDLVEMIPAQEVNDSIKISQAIMELMMKDSPIDVKLDSKNQISEIRRNGKKLRGTKLKIYSEAYSRLQDYSAKAIDRKSSIEAKREREAIKNRTEEELRLYEEYKKAYEITLKRLQEQEIALHRLNSKGVDSIRVKEENILLLTRELKVLEERLNLKQDSVKIIELLDLSNALQKRIDEIRKVQDDNKKGGNVARSMEDLFKENDALVFDMTAPINQDVTWELVQNKDIPEMKDVIIIVDGEVKKGWTVEDLNKLGVGDIATLSVIKMPKALETYADFDLKDNQAIIEIRTL